MTFLKERIGDNSLDEALTLSRIAWNKFPELKLSTESKAVIQSMLRSVEENIQQILNPLQMGTSTILALSKQLSELTQQLPTNLRQEIATKIEEVQKQLKSLEELTSKSSEPVIKQMNELNITINTLMSKPKSKGTFFENTLAEAWQATFLKDKIIAKGGGGESDLIIIPYIGNKEGGKISIERKAGAQKYSQNHVTEAIQHAKDDGSQYAMVVYDSPDKIPETLGVMSIELQDNIFVTVTDVQSTGWKIARYVIAAIQSASKTAEDLDGIDLKEVKNIIADMHNINSQIEKLRRKNNSVIKSSGEVRDLIDSLEELLGKYLDRLQLALNPAQQGQN